MRISEISVQRPVLATVMSLLIVLVGLISYGRLSVREYPNIDPPVVTVQTDYRGASPQIVETQVTQIIEDSLAGIDGIEYMTSISRPEQSLITVTFKLNRDPDLVANDVRDRVSRVRGQLPDEIDEPVIQKVEADAQPIIYLAFSSSRHSALEVTDYADRYVKDRLQTQAGVAEVRILGERRYAMRIWLDPLRLTAFGMTPQDVEDALRRQNIEVPAGRIESREREFTVLSETDLRTPREFNDLILRESPGYLVRLSDVGRAELGAKNERLEVRYRGQSSVALGVVKQSTANPLDVSKAIRAEMAAIQRDLPEGMRVDVGYDSSVFIEESINNVFRSIFEAVALVVLIIFLFLRSLRATLVPLVTIPVALIGSFALMDALGFTINTITLLAMVLAIGLVVDDAIVMLENIHRHVEAGMTPRRAALVGSREIGFAVIAMTLTLVAVYAPVGFIVGNTGRLFSEFAWSLAGAVLVSGFVALTLSPMMCGLLLHHQARHSAIYNLSERLIVGLAEGYRRALGASLRARALVVIVGLVVAAAGGWLFRSLNAELAPIEDRGTIVGIGLAPEGATLAYTDRYARAIEALYAQVPEAERYFVVTGFPVVTQIISFIGLTHWEKRDRSQQEIVQSLRGPMFAIPGVLAFPNNPASLGQNPAARPLQFVIQTSASYQDLQAMVDRMMAEVRKNPAIVNPDVDLKLNKPQLTVVVDRDKAADLGVPMATIGRTLETMLGGREVTRFKREGEQYDVIVQMASGDRTRPDDLARIYVRARSGEMVPLANLVTIREDVAPKDLNRFDKLRAASISANLAPGYTIGQAIAFMEQAARQALPASARVDYAGESREFKQASFSLYVIFVMALAFIYLVLAAQFESFLDPVVIMMTVPLSMAGALLALHLVGGTVNIYSQVGMITLVGLITKHGILIVEFANQLRRQGKALTEAVIEASVLRLRPILMTTGAMVFGALPLAYATGAGGESRQAIGVVIVGGLLVGTFFTLFVIPTVYSLVARGRHATPIAADEPPSAPVKMPAE